MILANHGIISSSGGVSFDADALAFITAASITDNTQKTVINTLVTDLKNANIWTKMKAIYPFVGGSATSHKWNLKDPRDLDAAYRLVFSGGWTHTSTGALPNGSNTYADTKFNPSTALSVNNTHLSFYSRTDIVRDDEFVIGVGTNLGANLFTMAVKRNVLYTSQTALFDSGTYPSGRIGYTNSDGRGYFIGSITANNSRNFYKNNTLVANSTSVYNQTFGSANIFIGAYNNYDGGGATSYTNKECAFATIGDGLNSSETSALYNAVQAFQTTLGRQV